MSPTDRSAGEDVLYDVGVVDVPTDHAKPVPSAPCPACGAGETIPLYAIEGFDLRLVVCTGCGTGRVDPLPAPQAVERFYPPSYYGDLGAKFRGPIELLVRIVAARQARFLVRGLPHGSRVLDVGCGRGVLLGALADRGVEAHGFEISADAARGTDPRAHLRVAADVSAAGYPDGFFDAVVVWHVLEHVPDPAATLAAIRRVLRPGGRLVVAVPNFASSQARWAGAAWFHLDLPRHLYHFPLAALHRLLERHRFEVASEHHFSLRQNPFGWIQSALNRNPRLPRNGLYQLLYRRGGGESRPYDRRTRATLLSGLVLGALPALAATVVESTFRRGGTVHVVARRKE